MFVFVVFAWVCLFCSVWAGLLLFVLWIRRSPAHNIIIYVVVHPIFFTIPVSGKKGHPQIRCI